MQIKIGERIRELRHRDGRKQEDLAKALGVLVKQFHDGRQTADIQIWK